MGNNLIFYRKKKGHEVHDGILRIEYSIDGGVTGQVYAGPFVVSLTEVAKLQAKALDRAGNEQFPFQRFVSTQLTTSQGDQAAALLDKLRKGVEELLLLAVLQEEEGYPLRYSLQLTHFQEKPCWRPQAMAQACKLDWPQQTEWVLLLRDFMQKADQDPVAVPLACPPPKALSIDYGFLVRANQLHQRLDYSRPFTVIIKCNRPDPRLHLTCCFRLLLANSPDRTPQRKQTKG